jgi:hypothetical protein
MMRKKRFKQQLRAIGVVAAALLATGCASTGPKFEKFAPAPQTLSQIRTIAVIRPPSAAFEIKDLDSMRFSSWGMLGAVAKKSRDANLNDAVVQMQASGPAFSAALADDMAEKLRAWGFTVTVEDGPWQSADGLLTMPCERTSSKADAVLVIVPTTIGFVNQGGPFARYDSSITAITTLVGADRTQKLYKEYHAIGWKPMQGEWKYSPSQGSYQNVKAILDDIPGALDAMRGARFALADSIAADLRR